MSAKTEGVQKLWNRYKYVVFVVLIGAGLLLWPSGTTDTDRFLPEQNMKAEPRDLETEMADILGAMDGGSGNAVVVTRTVYPTYRGALIVCQGGDRAEVKLAVTEAVAALTGLSADRITVAKWQ